MKNCSHILATAMMAMTAMLSSCQQEVEEPSPVIRPVRYRAVYATGGARIRTFTGAAKAEIESKLSFKVPGTVLTLNVDVGDHTRAGKLIAELDRRDYELQVEEAEASLAQARAQAVRAEADFERIRGLFERDNASQGDYDAGRAARDSARAQVRAVEKKLEGAKLQLAYTRLKSPVSGTVAEVLVEVNENTRAGDPIVVLNSGILPEVEVGIPEILIGQVQKGHPVTVTFDATGDTRFRASVTEVGVALGQRSTTYPVTVRLNRRHEGIRPGMTAEVSFRFGGEGERERYILPPHAVIEDRQGRFVYVVHPKGESRGKVERRAVVVGELARDGIEVYEGLRDGDLVVITGAGRITDGQEVKLSEEYQG